MIDRRQTLARAAALLAAGATALPGLALAADDFPSKPVRLVIPYPAGGATDLIARIVADKLTAKWGQSVIADNRPGAGTTIGAEAVAKSPPDGYTLFMTTSAHTISASLYKKLSYDPLKDFTPITLVATIPLVLVVAPELPVKNVQELVALAQSSPKGLSIASPGNGTAQHLAGELFKNRAKIESTHIPYRGDAPMINDLLGGQVQAGFVTLSVAIPYIQGGKLKALALAHGKRIDAIKAVPTFAEAGYPGFEAATWFGLMGPAGMPPALVKKIRTDVAAIVDTPQTRDKLVEMGAEVNNSTPEAFEAFMTKESARWKEAVRISGARLD
ncbi:tripartite tricarboxylate transporter substrate binding protein [Xylophilus rhododendri]|uniref:Tripartite tricarboxylate transporter substrate binding protein n=1 Tax=Xylophilus rhododendri TaxID=2697032 RepID=A0A857J668_9BURK|nr:tripartite tricarboxylate transporter substrate binding protein [Xylophilus rhododendri]QHI98512.1 tripartite tricarboxylate transporter substrate binding protein [Xylophilus rhododendri]